MNILSGVAISLIFAAFEMPLGYEALPSQPLLEHEQKTTAVGVPEPSTLALGALGLLSVAAIRRRKSLASRNERTT